MVRASLFSKRYAIPKWLLAMLALVPAAVWTGKQVAIRGTGLLLRVMSKAEASAGGSFAVALIGVSAVLYLAWMVILLRGKPRNALGYYILLLPLSNRFARVGGIVAYASQGGTTRVISLTTLLLFLLLMTLRARGVPLRRTDQNFRKFEKLVWLFSITSTVAQLANHTPRSAFWLSVGGVWQYVALFYVVFAVVRSLEDVKYILACMVGSLIVAFVVSVGTYGQFASVYDPARGYVRLGSVVAPAAHYAGYVALCIVLALYLVRSAQSRKEAIFWLLTTGLLGFQLLQALTRGGWLSLVWVCLLVIWKSERRFLSRIGLLLLVTIVVAGQQMAEIVSRREWSSDLMQMAGIPGRLEAWRLSLPHVFDNWGLGHGMSKDLLLPTSYGLVVSHNLILFLTQEVGAIATIVFLVFFFSVLWKLFLSSLTHKTVWRQGNQGAYLAVALIMWFFYANTTGLQITYGVSMEATMLFYLTLFLSCEFVVRQSAIT